MTNDYVLIFNFYSWIYGFPTENLLNNDEVCIFSITSSTHSFLSPESFHSFIYLRTICILNIPLAFLIILSNLYWSFWYKKLWNWLIYCLLLYSFPFLTFVSSFISTLSGISQFTFCSITIITIFIFVLILEINSFGIQYHSFYNCLSEIFFWLKWIF